MAVSLVSLSSSLINKYRGSPLCPLAPYRLLLTLIWTSPPTPCSSPERLSWLRLLLLPPLYGCDYAGQAWKPRLFLSLMPCRDCLSDEPYTANTSHMVAGNARCRWSQGCQTNWSSFFWSRSRLEGKCNMMHGSDWLMQISLLKKITPPSHKERDAN